MPLPLHLPTIVILAPASSPRIVMPGLDPGIYVMPLGYGATWMAGSSPATTIKAILINQITL